MRKILGFAVAAAFLAAGTARAQGPSGFSLGARVGYGIPMGDAWAADVASGSPSMSLSDWFKGQVPIQLEAMYRFDPSWSAGLYVQYGFASVGSGVSDLFCPAGSGFSCSATDLRFGAQLHYRFTSQGFVPWVGLGLGGEWSTLKVEMSGVSADVKLSGFEFVNFQVGGDWLLSPAFRLGPYVELSVGQYGSLSAVGQSVTIPSKSTHEWLRFGVKGTFDL